MPPRMGSWQPERLRYRRERSRTARSLNRILPSPQECSCRAQRFRTTAWLFPLFSTRWHDLFGYGQVKTEINLGIAVRPYVSMRFVGDTRGTVSAANPEYLSESSFILAVGAATQTWHGVRAWGEAGSAISYVKGHMLPDY